MLIDCINLRNERDIVMICYNWTVTSMGRRQRETQRKKDRNDQRLNR